MIKFSNFSCLRQTGFAGWVIFLMFHCGAIAQTPSCFWANKTGAVDYDYGRAVATDTSGHIYVAGHFYGTGDFDPGTGTLNLVTKGGYDIFISKLDTAGNLIWLKQVGGSNNDYLNDIAVDAWGNIYLTGNFSGTCDFDPDAGLVEKTSFGGKDIFLAKLDSSGSLIWATQKGGADEESGNSLALYNNYLYATGTFSGTADFDPGSSFELTSYGGTDIFFLSSDTSGGFISAMQMGGSDNDEGMAMTVGISYGYGYVYLTGSFSGTADLDPGSGTYNLTSSGGTDIFITRMDYLGNFISSRNIGGIGNDAGRSIIADNTYYVYLTGSFEDTVDFRPGTGTAYLYSAGGADIFVLKLLYGTSLTWVSQIGGTENDFGNSIVVDPSFNTYVTGSFSGTTDFNPDVATYELSAQGLDDIFIEKLDIMGNLTWVKQIGEIATDDGKQIAIDASGNIYTTGHFSGSNVDFDPGIGSSYQSSSGSMDVFIQRLDGSGNYSWALKMGSGSINTLNSLQIDANGNVYTTGYFSGTADFDAGPSLYNISSIGTNDIFISKTSSSGDFVWTRQIGSTGIDIAQSLILDTDGNIYVTGYFSATADFDPGAGVSTMTSGGSYDVFVLKLDSSGNFIWAKQLGSLSTDYGYSLAFDNIGNLLIGGYFYCCVASDFDPGPGVFNLTSVGGADIFICKLDTSGNFIWANSFGGANTEMLFKIFSDKNGNIYTTGQFSTTADFDPGTGVYNLTATGGNDAFISKLSSSGDFLWAKKIGGSDTDMGYSLAVDDFGNVYAGGSFSLTTDLDPGSGTYNLTSLGGTDLYLLKLDSSGNFIKVAHIGSDGSEAVRSISLDGKGNIYFSGNFGGIDDFDPGPGTYFMTSSGKPDAYLCKYDTAFNFLWAKGWGGPEVDNCYSFSIDSLGNIYAGGTFGGTADLKPGNEELFFTADGTNDIFTIKFHPVVFSAISTGVSCYGGNDGNGNINVIEGNQPFSYNWDNGETTQMASVLTSGSHYVTVTDALGCAQGSGSISVTQPPVIFTALTIANALSCKNGNDGIAAAAGSGGSGNLSYDWSNGDTTLTADQLFAGMYYITVTDTNNCSKVDSILVSEPTAVSNSFSKTDVFCKGGSNGTATAIGSGGTPPYSYQWNTNPVQTTSTAVSLKAQVYSVTITDANGCIKIDSTTINEPTLLTSTMTKTDVSCYMGNDGTATAIPSGGTSPYTYYWNIGQTGQTATSLYPGNYAVNILDALGCSSNNIVSIAQPSSLSLTVSGTNNNCNSGSNGTAIANSSGGTLPYSYLWSNGAITASLTGLSAGTYSVTVTDSCSNFMIDSVEITEPQALGSIINVTNISCTGFNNGSITLNPNGGTSPYSYLWNTGETTKTISGLTPGSYSVTITDNCGLTKVKNGTVTEPAPINATSVSAINATCFGIGNGAATVNATGGTSPYTYYWNNGQSTQTAIGLFAGTYVVNVFDSKGCLASNSVTIAQPAQLAATLSSVNVSCNSGSDGTVTANVSGGTSPYSYLWSNGSDSTSLIGIIAGTYGVTVTDSCGASVTQSVDISQPAVLSSIITKSDVNCSGGANGSATISVSGGVSTYSYLWSTGSALQNIASLPQGTYYVTATDNCAQTIIDSAVITAPSALTTSIVKTDVSCNGAGDGTATVNAAGGTSPYTYFWSNNQSAQTAVGLFPGFYSVNVVDANGCLATNNTNITQPAALSASVTATNVSCNSGSDGSASLIAVGGTSPYSYLWNNGAITQNITSIPAGDYSVTITDSCGATVIQTVNITQPGILSAISTKTNVSCNGGMDGSASFTVNGGVAPYTYNWSNGAVTSQISNIPSQTYYVTVTDYCGLVLTDSTIIGEPAMLVSSISGTDVTCNGLGDGTATVAASGGTTPYTYSWNNGQSSASAIGLFAGNYSVNVFDANFCLASNVVSIIQPAALSLSISSSAATCGNTDGSATSDVTGGTFPYAYLWSDSSSMATVTGLDNGSISITVTDANNCTDSASISVGVTTIPQEICLVTVDSSNTKNLITWEKPAVTNIDSFRIYRDIVGVYTKIGAVAYSDLSKFIDNTNGIDPAITSYRYKITAVDTCGNESAFSAYHKTMHLTKNIGTQGEVNLIWDGYEGFSTGFYYRLLKDSTGSGNFIPIDSVSNNNFTYTAPPPTANTQYVIEVVHPSGGCLVTMKSVENHNSSRSNKTFAAPPGSSLSASTSSLAASAGNCDGMAIVSAVDGLSPYTYQWDGNAGNQATDTASGLCPGTYSVTVTDASGDFTIVFATVDVMPGIKTNLPGETDICIYPNPNSGEFTLEIKNLNTGASGAQFIITNILGEMVYQSAVLPEVLKNKFQISLRGKASGVYNLQMIDNEKTIYRKIIVE